MPMNTWSDFDYTPYQRSIKPWVNAKRRLKWMRKKQMDLEIEQSDIQSLEFEYPRIENKEIIKLITFEPENYINKIQYILNDAWNKGKNWEDIDYVNEFMSRPRVWGHILVDWELYEIRKLPMHPAWSVMVRKKDYTSQNIQEEIPMPYDFIKNHMIPDQEATEIIASQRLSWSRGDGVYFVDKEWWMHPDMASVRRANSEIMDRRYPLKIKNVE